MTQPSDITYFSDSQLNEMYLVLEQQVNARWLGKEHKPNIENLINKYETQYHEFLTVNQKGDIYKFKTLLDIAEMECDRFGINNIRYKYFIFLSLIDSFKNKYMIDETIEQSNPRTSLLTDYVYSILSSLFANKCYSIEDDATEVDIDKILENRPNNSWLGCGPGLISSGNAC